MRLLLIVLAIALAGAAPAAAKVHVPRAARAVDTSHPDRWVGSGTPQSCTSRAVVRAVAKGGIIRFRCGPDRCEGLTSADGDATGETFDGGGGGAIFARGGRLKIVRSTFTGHRCDPTGPDLGGGAVRALPQFTTGRSSSYAARSATAPAATGAALSSIGVSWSI